MQRHLRRAMLVVHHANRHGRTTAGGRNGDSDAQDPRSAWPDQGATGPDQGAAWPDKSATWTDEGATRPDQGAAWARQPPHKVGTSR
jgi:hypothetical protein